MLAASGPAPRDAAPEGDRSKTGATPSKNEMSQSGQAEGPEADYSRWTSLVKRIRAGDKSGMEELYSLFSKGVRFYLCRQLGPQELDDKVHDAFLVVVQAIRRGDLREPERLMGFVRTVVRRQVAAYIDRASHRRRDMAELDTGFPIVDGRSTPEEQTISQEKVDIMKKVLGEVSDRDREILTRFYLREQPQHQICTEMGLTETQFRLLKSRAKARFGELGKKKLVRRSMARLFLRTSSGGKH